MMIIICAACGSSGAATPDADLPDAFCAARTIPDGAPGECIAPAGAPVGGSHVIYLNFEGGTIYPGNDDATNNVSSQPNVTTMIPPFLAFDADRDARIAKVVALVTETFAPFDVAIVTTRPAAGPYAMVMFGGSGPDVGVAVTLFGVAPFNCGQIPNAVTFVFDTASDPEVAHRVAVTTVLETYAMEPTITRGDCTCVDGTFCDLSPTCGTCTLSHTAMLRLRSMCGGDNQVIDEPVRLDVLFGCRH
jgi:hypothetical protein